MKLSSPTNINVLRFEISKIIIGQWTRDAVFPESLMAKWDFSKKKLLWEIRDDPEDTQKLAKKIEMHWIDVSSLGLDVHPDDGTGILTVELFRAPTLFIETDPNPMKQTVWKQMDQDFTRNQASSCRIHTLYFASGVLQENIANLVSRDSFWTNFINDPANRLLEHQVSGPLEELTPYAQTHNTRNGFTKPLFSTPSSHMGRRFDNSELLQLQSQAVGKRKRRIITHIWYDDGSHNSSYVEDEDSVTELRGTQVLPPRREPSESNPRVQ